MFEIKLSVQLDVEPQTRTLLGEMLRALTSVREDNTSASRLLSTAMSLSSHDDVAMQSAPPPAVHPLEPLAPLAGEAPKRERGKPGPGRQRRTKEEMAEDAAAEAAEAQAGPPQISANPEARVGPQDTPEDQVQDAADERVESEANHPPGLTLDDVREAVGRYYGRYGMGPATADIQAIFGCKLHEIPDNQEAFRKAITAVDAATENNPYGRTAVGGSTPAVKPTLDDLKVVMGRYMKTFGEDEGYADLPKILGIARVTDLPADPEVYKAKIALVEDALVGNPFGRKVRP